MRIIKFRGQMTTGEWVYGLPHIDLPGSTAYYNECSYRICWHPESGGGANAPIKNGTLSQYTGLNDKNGNEIYEGDIVKCFHYEIDIPEDYFSIFSVEYNDKQGLYCVGKAHNISLARHRDIEIVGNIYENPELI